MVFMRNKRIFFIFLFTLFFAVKIACPQDAETKPPNVCVTGIMYDAQNSLAVVNGESVKHGEEINGVKVVKISESTVSFEYKGQSFERRISEGCPPAPFLSKQTSQITKIISASKPKKITSKTSRSNRKAIQIQQQVVLFGVIILALSLILYIYSSLCLHKIANKTNTPFAWFAWLPVVSIFLMLMIAKKSFCWLVLLLIPIVNFVCIIIIWMEIAKMRNKPGWLGILMMLPFVNFFIVGYLAFSS